MTKSESGRPQRLETALAYLATGLIAISLISLAITLLTNLLGQKTNLAIFAQIPLIGLPLGFLLVITLILASLIRKGKENRE